MHESDSHMARQAVSDRQQNLRWQALLQVDMTNMNNKLDQLIHIQLAHGLSVKLSLCPCIHTVAALARQTAALSACVVTYMLPLYSYKICYSLRRTKG